MKHLISALLLAGAPLLALAQATPVGLWKTVDDETKDERAHIRIADSGGVLSGRIEKVLTPGMAPGAVCDLCEDDRKGKPFLGMEILRGVKKADGKADTWDGGTVLDAAKGKVYKVRLQPTDGGRKLEVRGYIGTPMLGRTQTWIRVE